MVRIFEKNDKELDIIFNSLCEGIDFDIKNKKVSFNPNHENRINTGSLENTKPIYSEFRNVYTGQKYKLISIFERKKDLSGLDGN
ncbi:MAG: hypothetical protein K2M17_02085 [Bacilli bacterium]|nr:hypothetical protein [Bacilli bacterium]